MARENPILIVGGGLGGLTTAVALARRGIASRVLEGAPNFGVPYLGKINTISNAAVHSRCLNHVGSGLSAFGCRLNRSMQHRR